jgi:predicted nucleotidyltransferase
VSSMTGSSRMLTADGASETRMPDGGLPTYLDVLDDVLAAVRDAEIPFLFIGGIGSAVFGRDRWTHDIDVFVRPESAPRVLDALSGRGFETKVQDEHWLYKAWRDGVPIDVIFRSWRDILLDDEMLARARIVPFHGRELPIAPPEDLLVMKAIAAAEDTPRYWYDALAILGQTELDWDYLVTRARRHGARRILSLLLFAGSVDLVVPPGPIETLYQAITGAS